MPKTSAKPSNRATTFKLTIAYDGTNYAGWQLQPNGLSIQEALERALEKIFKTKIRVHGSGRTDAGVHARGQVAHFSVETTMTPQILQRALNASLPYDVRILRVARAPKNFHARFSAKEKEYRYQIDCGEVADPFLLRYAWHHPKPLDVSAMRKAAKILMGKHNFLAFSANPLRPVDDPVRKIGKFSVTKRGDLVTICVKADGFLYKMVRSLVGALVKVGEGKLTLERLKAILASQKRTALIETAPAHGLFLWRVFYE
jgi:tRNA pseudouridine38-40 synthase